MAFSPTEAPEPLRRLAVALALAAAVGGLSAAGLLAPAQRWTADAVVRAASRLPPAPPPGIPDVAIVALDAQSLRAHPDWPWPRSRYAALIDRLDAAGVRAVAFDIDFSSPRDPSEDARFAEAIRRSGRVVLAAFRQRTQTPDGLELEIASLPAEHFANAAAAVGSVLVEVQPDGVVRQAPRSVSLAGTPTDSLAGAALDVALGGAAKQAGDAPITLDYRRIDPPFPVLSLSDVLDGRFDPRDLAGRIVLVGATAAELQDLWSTPLGPARPGVLLQALAVRTLAAERAGLAVQRSAGPLATIGLLVAVSWLAAGLSAAAAGRRVALLALLAAAVGGGTLALATADGLLLDAVTPLGVIGAHYAFGLEAVRRRFGRRLAERDLSLSALFEVGAATAGPRRDGGLELALRLLGDVTDASGVALLRVDRTRRDGECRLEWRRRASDGAPVGDAALADQVLEERRVRVFEARLPGPGARKGVAVYAPLLAGETPVGVLVVEREGARGLDETQLRTIATVGAQIALSAENVRLIDDLKETLDASITAVASAVEARDGYTDAHCRRLAVFSACVAAELGLPEREIEAIRLGALLHDVGKIGIRDEVLLKPGRFTPEERRDMQRHPDIGARIVGPIRGLSGATLDCVRHHHERWDGTGYPDGLAAEEIPLAARIVAVIDVWDALSTNRPYKAAYSQERVRALLEKEKGHQFDPAVVDLFLRVLDDRGEEILALCGPSARGGAS